VFKRFKRILSYQGDQEMGALLEAVKGVGSSVTKTLGGGRSGKKRKGKSSKRGKGSFGNQKIWK
jgi:hypothetical protein